MKIALSASFFNVKQVRELLEECEVIYSTNVDIADGLLDAFGERMKFIPSSSETWLAFVRSQHEGCEFVTFGDLRRIFQERLLAGDEQLILDNAEYLGWRRTPVLRGFGVKDAVGWYRIGAIGIADSKDKVPEEVYQYHKCVRKAGV